MMQSGIMTADNGHHKYSPSKLKLLAQCPGYTGDDEPSEAAEEGTRLHAAAETGDMAGLTDEQRGFVQMCLDYVAETTGDCQAILREYHLKTLGGGEKGTEGTADVIAVNGAHAHVIDYKFGRVGVDPAETNLQGYAYALGVFDEFEAESVTVHFLLPRRDEVSRAVFTRDEYPRMAIAVGSVLNLCHNFEAMGRPVSMLAPSPAGCKWCGNRGECPALAAPCTDLATRANGSLTMPAETNPGLMTAPQLAQALDVGGILDAWVKRWNDSVKAEAARRIKGGVAVGTYGIKRRAGLREISDAVAASRILAEFGLTAEDMGAVMRVRLGDAEKAVAARAGRGNGKKAVEALSDALEAAGLLTRKPDQEFVAEMN